MKKDAFGFVFRFVFSVCLLTSVLFFMFYLLGGEEITDIPVMAREIMVIIAILFSIFFASDK